MKLIRLFILSSAIITGTFFTANGARAGATRDTETVQTEIRENQRELRGHELRAQSLQRNIVNTEMHPSEGDPRQSMLGDMKAELEEVRAEIRDLQSENQQLQAELRQRASLPACAADEHHAVRHKPGSRRGDELDRFIAGFQAGMESPKNSRCASVSTNSGSKPDAFELGYDAGKNDSESGSAH